jgi:hypothetical protein
MTTLEKWSQVGILAFGVTAVWCSQSPDPEVVRRACLFGLASQPFWVYTTIKSRQFGALLLTAIYAASWARGVNTYWLGWF